MECDANTTINDKTFERNDKKNINVPLTKS